jgi:flagellar basal-body rod protein FlgF
MTSGLAELGEVMLSASERRLETVSRNIANISTPGFKTERSFSEALGASAAKASAARSAATDFSQGSLRVTGNALDLALSGAGFFKLRSQAGVYLSRGGQFERASDGTVRTAQGLSLLTATGEDLVVSNGKIEILEDGTVLEGGLPVARLAVVESEEAKILEAMGGGLFSAPGEALRNTSASIVRQGMLEASNVEMAGEMVEMMSALRQAEAGARIVQVFDTLSGQMISTFSQGGR